MKKLTIWILIVSLFGSILISCSNSDKIINTDTSADTTAPAEQPVENAQSVLERFDKVDYSGKTFTIMAASNYLGVLSITQIPAEKEVGEVVNDALIYRDQLVNEYFGIDIVYNDVADNVIESQVSKLTASGDDSVDLVLSSIGFAANSLFVKGLLMNLNEIPYIDLSHEWWNKNSIRDFSVNNQIYMATGDITTRSVVSPFALLFNKGLLDSYNIDNPYNPVSIGTWTIETFGNMIKGTANDINGDSKLKIDDFFGLSPEGSSPYAFYASAGGRVVTNTGDSLEIYYSTEESIGIIRKVSEVLSSGDVMVISKVYDANKAFKENRSLFLSCALCDLTLLRDMKNDFGIVPLPKINEEQKDYYSSANTAIGTMVIVPKSVSDTEKVGLITEALGAVSHYTSIVAQYETTMQIKLTRDEESTRMLQLVVDSTTYDIGYLNNIGDVSSIVSEALIHNGNDVASKFEKQSKAAQNKLDAVLKCFADPNA